MLKVLKYGFTQCEDPDIGVRPADHSTILSSKQLIIRMEDEDKLFQLCVKAIIAQKLKEIDQEFLKCKSFDISDSNDNVLICSGEILRPAEHVEVSFSWMDQGWGNRKGMLFFLLKCGDQIHSWSPPDVAPHKRANTTAKIFSGNVIQPGDFMEVA